ncbi:MAG: UDP-N-acetylmuramoyl-L-alanyl-D-glutamate--2,6-diaminopimelate ligase [Patescibacteria group bacterium]
MKSFIRSLLPEPVLGAYHLLLAALGAAYYGYPSRKLTVIAVTGTKGKSTTAELVAAILRGAGQKVALASTIHFIIGEEEEPNLYKMTMPGRFFLQKFLRRAVTAGCTHAVIEMTSEGARQYRHKGVSLNALVFTNLSPEHLESHGGMEAYADAKLSLARALAESPKRPRVMVANADDPWGEKFFEVAVDIKAPFRLADAEPYNTDDKSIRFVWRGTLFSVPLPGLFNLKNCLAALALGEALGLPLETMKKALEHVGPIAGRVQRIVQGQPFDVVVDYAHTADSLRALFETFKNKKITAVFGATGGGRDKWKRPAMGKVADEFCGMAYLTDDDSYDEDPKEITAQIAQGFSRIKPVTEVDRRKAIALALAQAKEGDAVLIAGKGTDPYLMGPRGTKEPWSDAKVVGEELVKLGYH